MLGHLGSLAIVKRNVDFCLHIGRTSGYPLSGELSMSSGGPRHGALSQVGSLCPVSEAITRGPSGQR